MGQRDVYTVDLGVDGLEFFSLVTAEYELSGAEKILLSQAAQVVDMIALLGESLATITVTGSTGQPVVNPIISAISDQRRVLVSLLSALDLPDAGQEAGDAEVANIDFFRTRRGSHGG